MTRTGESLDQIISRLRRSNDELQSVVVQTSETTKVVPDLNSIIDQIVKTQSLPISEEKDYKNVFQKFLLVVAACLALIVGKEQLKPYLPFLSDSIEVAQNTVSDLASSIVEPLKPEEKISVIEVKPDVVTLKIENGKNEIRTGGSVSWRYNNPGLIFSGPYTKNLEIGSDGKYAIFKNYLDGRTSLEKLLFESDQGYKSKSLENALKFYAPKNEGFNTDYYISTIRKDTGIPLTKIMSEFNSDERKILLDTLEKIERFTSGTVEIK